MPDPQKGSIRQKPNCPAALRAPCRTHDNAQRLPDSDDHNRNSCSWREFAIHLTHHRAGLNDKKRQREDAADKNCEFGFHGRFLFKHELLLLEFGGAWKIHGGVPQSVSALICCGASPGAHDQSVPSFFRATLMFNPAAR